KISYQNATGYFVNPIVINRSFDAKQSLSDFLKKSYQDVVVSMVHSDYPFIELANEFQPERDHSRAPLAQTAVIWLDASMIKSRQPIIQTNRNNKEVWHVGGMEWVRMDLRGQADDFDLVLVMMTVKDNLFCALEYNDSIFDHATIVRMTNHFKNLCNAVAENIQMKIADLPLLDAQEMYQILYMYNKNDIQYDMEMCTHQWFEYQAQKNANSIAVIDGTTDYTFNEINNSANQLARYLKKRGVKSDGIVGVCTDRSVKMIVSLYAIYKAGAAHLPLDPNYPRERLEFLIKDANVEIVISQSDLIENLPGNSYQTILLDVEYNQINKENENNLNIPVQLNNLNYVIYTSGSTGCPKGVAIEHRGISSLINCFSNIFTPQELKGVLVQASLNFDMSILEIILPLSLGGTIILAENALHLPTLPAREKVKLVFMVPSVMKSLLQIQGLPQNVMTVHLGGEPVSKALVKKLYQLNHIKKVFNLYGPSEYSVLCTYNFIGRDLEQKPFLGKPIPNCRIYVLDSLLQPVPIGMPGELCVGGVGVARGYLNQPELMQERFIRNPFIDEAAPILYRTGDLVKMRNNGELDFIGRNDFQVKIRGFRIELEEIENTIYEYPGIHSAVIEAVENKSGDKNIVAYIENRDTKKITSAQIRSFLKAKLPEYMIPSIIIFIKSMPLMPNGKFDRKSLPDPYLFQKNNTKYARKERRSPTESLISKIWSEVLDTQHIGIYGNFFEIGGHSLLLVKMLVQLLKHIDSITLIDLYRYPTVHSLAAFIDQKQSKKNISSSPQLHQKTSKKSFGIDRSKCQKIAITGLACRFPGAENAEQYWDNIIKGIETISDFSPEADDIVSQKFSKHKNFVSRSGILNNIDLFDSDFFHFTPKEAKKTDPQHRLFLECAWQALEAAGIDPTRQTTKIGIYAGCGINNYLLKNIVDLYSYDLTSSQIENMLGNSYDFFTTRVAYKLGLKGPAITMQTACSTSLAAVHMAVNSLLNHDCDVALAGGISLGSLEKGYLYQENMIMSPDGHCRAFDARANGCVPAQGVGIVVLKRLQDALQQGNQIHAVILGSAINNDGNDKVGFTAPSINGQAQVIESAMAKAQVLPETITLIEAHGTGTIVGDPIEIAGLKQAFKNDMFEKNKCAIGSVKTNIGHTDAASGVAGLIKATLALKNKILPPSLHFQSPNPEIDFDNSPFYVNTKTKPWDTNRLVRRAGVSSFGLGGTNAHVILEEPPEFEEIEETSWQLFPLTAKTPTALVSICNNLKKYLEQDEGLIPANVAFTLQTGRQFFSHRTFFICNNLKDLAVNLNNDAQRKIFNFSRDESLPALTFIFSDEICFCPEILKKLYQDRAGYKMVVDECIQLVKQNYPDLFYYFDENDLKGHSERLDQTIVKQPAQFIVKYSIAKFFMACGVYPDSLIGEGVGDYVSACLAGVINLKDALYVVIERAKLIEKYISVINHSDPNISYNHDQIIIKNAFKDILKKVTLRPPQKSFFSCTLGIEFEVDKIINDDILVDHLLNKKSLTEKHFNIFQNQKIIFIGMASESDFNHLFQEDLNLVDNHLFLSTLPAENGSWQNSCLLLETLGNLWALGFDLNWDQLHDNQQRRLCTLPTYPFERKRYWIDQPEKLVSLSSPTDIECKQNSYKGVLKKSEPKKQLMISDEQIVKDLAEIWSNAFGSDQIDIDDDFFELGGDSLLAVQVIEKISEHFQIDLSSHAIMNASTIALLTKEVQNLIKPEKELIPKQKNTSLVLELHKGNQNPSLFLIHVGGGHLYSYNDFVRNFKGNHSIFGIIPRGLKGEAPPVNSIEKMADIYLEEILTIQPQGPYWLGGSSFGGMVAYELANRIHNKLGDVQLLFMVDTPGPGQMMKPFEDDAAMLDHMFGEELSFSAKQLREHSINLQSQIAFISARANEIQKENSLPPDFGLHYVDMVKTHTNSMFKYKPKAYTGPLLFFRHNEEMPEYAAHPELAWLPFVEKEANVYTINGNHLTMNMGNNVLQMVKHIKRYLKDKAILKE
ncbi:non-ribosomal peptide synthetase/polyketide synthase, partial [Candidatus Magnetomorum sp. HK-1]